MNSSTSGRLSFFASISCCAFLVPLCLSADPNEPESPADHLPPYMERLTSFGERADFSADGKRILFLSKTFGDAMELDLATRQIRNLTSHYSHFGYTRALYLSNGDILLSGPTAFDPAKPGDARRNCTLFVLPHDRLEPPVPLGVPCSEGPAVSRRRLHIAWTELTGDKPGEGGHGTSRMFEADVTFTDGKPTLTHRKLIVDERDLPVRCTMETQNFRPPAEQELIFSAYMNPGTDVLGIDLATKVVTNYTNSPDTYDEPEGIYPDGRYTLVECDKQNHLGPGQVDLWRLALDGSGDYTRLTHFTDYPPYKCSNPVVSDDGRFIACQLAKSTDPAGVGHGLFLYDIAKAFRAHE